MEDFRKSLREGLKNMFNRLLKADSIQESYSQAEGPPREENKPPAVAPMDFKAPPKAKVELPKWQGRPVSHPDHVVHLEQAAALNEFHHKMPREMAEEKAHRDYRLEQHSRAAAHHLQGMKAAQGSGDMDSARKHGAMYDMHLRQLGHEPVGPVPDSVRAHLDHPDRESIYKFKPHKGDIFLAQG